MNQTILPAAGPMTPATSTPATGIETASASAAALARASVEARYVMAVRQPRNWDSVRLRLLDACKRTAFAETARYSKPIGGSKVEGPSIRFAEEAARCMGNLLVESPIVHEDARQRILRVTVTDLETNLTYHADILVEKQVERRKVREGQTVIGQRLNSQGQQVFIVEASEDELLVKAAALASKALRTGVLRVLPGDIQEEAMAVVVATLRRQDEQDPSAARKKVCDAFYTMGVSPDQLEEYLGHPLTQCTPAELQDLRQVFAALKDGEATWAKVMESKPGTKDEKPDAKAKSEGKGQSRTERLKAGMSEAPAAPAPEAQQELEL